MFHIVLKIAVKGVHETFVARQLLEGDGVDEICRVFCHDDGDMCLLLFQHTGERSDLICGDAAGYSEYDMFSL